MSRLLKIFSFLLFGLVFCPVPGISQQPGSIAGVVLDDSTHQSIAGANIFIPDSPHGSVTDSSGYYLIRNIPPGEYRVMAQMIGYEPAVREDVIVRAGGTTQVDFALKSTVIPLQGVGVVAERIVEKEPISVGAGQIRMSYRTVLSLPGVLEDVTRALEVFPGAVTTSDFTSLLYVRGGTPDQNLVLLDDIEIPNPYRLRIALGGGLSIFNPDFVEDVDLLLGGFPARYGNRLAAVLKVKTKEAQRGRFSFTSRVNLLNFGITAEGPLTTKGSWIIAARKTYYDLIVNRLSHGDSAFPSFYDLQGKITLNPRKGDFSLLFIHSGEGTKLFSEPKEGESLKENAIVNLLGLKWRYQWANRLTLKARISYYRDKITFNSYREETNFYYTDLDYSVGNTAFGFDLFYRVNEFHRFTVGVDFYHRKSDLWWQAHPENISPDFELPRRIDYDKSYFYRALYCQNRWRIIQPLEVRLGLRYDYSTLINKGRISPRLSFDCKLGQGVSLKGAWGLFYQYPDPLSLFARDDPINISLNLEDLSPEKAIHFTLGLRWQFIDELSASAEFYYKKLNQLLVPTDRVDYYARNLGRGVAKGIEFFILKKSAQQGKGLSGLISYSYSVAKYLDGLHPTWRYFNHDRRHSFSLLGNVWLGRGWMLSFLWRFSSGLPYTPKNGLMRDEAREHWYWLPNWDFLSGEENSARYPNYHRLDLRISYHWALERKTLTLYLDLVNLYNRRNTYSYNWVTHKDDASKNIQLKRRTIYMLPFLPSLGVTFQM